MSDAAAVRAVRTAIIGERDAIPSCLGPRLITYADHTASGRAHSVFERYIREEVLPFYGNTHTTTSITGFQSDQFVSEARSIVRDATNASEKDDAVLFCGRGATAASALLAHLILSAAPSGGRDLGAPPSDHRCSFPACGRLFASSVELHLHARTHPDGDQTAHLSAPMRLPEASDLADAASPIAFPASAASASLSAAAMSSGAAVVFVGPYAHHSSLLPWRERGADLRHVPEDARHGGGVDLAALEALLHDAARSGSANEAPLRPPALLVGVFTAASNITGACCQVDAVTALCHRHGCLAVWDFAAAAPHVRLDMNPKPYVSGGSPAASFAKDAAYFSCHKLPGGPSAPGVLIVKRALLRGAAPNLPGGGTVLFVRSDGTPLYLADDALREEGGTPDVVAAVRAGLCFQLMRAIGHRTIASRESALAHVAREHWRQHPNLRIVGGSRGPRMPVIAFLVLEPESAGAGGPRLQLHWGFVCAVLNDVFGVQARGGCLCAGPYAQALLGIGPASASRLEAALLQRDELLRPGVVRVSFVYYSSHAAFRYVLSAVDWVATHGAKLLPYYTPVRETGEWRPVRSVLSTALQRGISLPDAEFSASCATGGVRFHAMAARTAAAATVTRSTVGDGGGHVAEAQRGATKAHPRRWLQSINFGTDGSVTWPTRRVTVRLSDDIGDGGVTETALFEAYAILADALIAQVVGDPPSTAVVSDASAVVLSTAGRNLRWFALASAPGAPSVRPGDAFPCWDMLEGSESLSAAESSAGEECGASNWDGIGFSESWMSPDENLVALLRVEPGELSTEQAAAWDGRAPAALTGDASVDGVDDEASDSVHRLGSAEVSPDPGIGSLQSRSEQHVPGKTKKIKTAKPQFPPGRGGLFRSSPSSSGQLASGAFAPTAVPLGASGPAELAKDSGKSALDLDAAVVPEKSESELPTAAAAAAAASLAHVALMRRAHAGLATLPAPPPKLQKALSRGMGLGLHQFGMLRDGDRVLVGLSGGKDSMSMLVLLLGLQARAPVRFEVGAVTVDPQYPGYDPSPLKAFCAQLGVPYFYESHAIVDQAAAHMAGRNVSICAWCSRMKRGILYNACRRESYNVLALGQHLDDFAESFVMSAFRNGLLRTMKAHYVNDARDVRIIRPLALLRERLTREYATAMRLPIISENCPACFEGPKERYHIKKLLAAEEALNPSLFSCLEHAMLPLMTERGSLAVKWAVKDLASAADATLEAGGGAGSVGAAVAALAAAVGAGASSRGGAGDDGGQDDEEADGVDGALGLAELLAASGGTGGSKRAAPECTADGCFLDYAADDD